jgi:hypothetical protein
VGIRKTTVSKLTSISALGAGALAVSAKNANAGIVYTVFPKPANTVGVSANTSFLVTQVAPGGFGGFSLFTTGSFHIRKSSSHTFSATVLLKIALKGFDGLRFQSAPGPGFIWNNTAPTFTYGILRSKRVNYVATATTGPSGPVPHYKTPFSTVLQDRQGDFYMLFQFNPTGSQVDYGWLRLNGHCNCGLDTEAVDLAFDDTGAVLPAGSAPEPATAIPTGVAALALGSTGLRRWRKSRKQAA